MKRLISLILPERCISCGNIVESGMDFCEDCQSKLHPMLEPVCNKCGRTVISCNCYKFKNFAADGLAISYWYKESIRNAVKRFKFSNQMKPAEFLASGMVNQIRKNYKDRLFDVIIAVPMHKKSVQNRGYNQSEILAKKISKELGILYSGRLLKKIRNTKIQHFLSREERMENIKGVYLADGKCKDLRILLVDDIVTTGATLNECAKTLKKAGAKEVYCVVAAATYKER